MVRALFRVVYYDLFSNSSAYITHTYSGYTTVLKCEHIMQLTIPIYIVFIRVSDKFWMEARAKLRERFILIIFF